jgi:CubicO group peptidase (beta-lactamase class C family)
MRNAWAVLVAATLFATGCSSATTSHSTAGLARAVEHVVDETVAAPLADRRFSGVVLVSQDGRMLLRKAYGFADQEQRIANTPATPFMIMSVSKQFTAALIARLVVKEKLRFDDKAGTYLDDWPSAWGEVTIGNLLSHSSGLHIDTTYAWLVKYHPEYWPEPGVAPPAYEPRLLETPPGTTYNYANVGYTLLSMIAARAGGLPFDELMRREVFDPLHLRNTRPERGGVRVPGRARGYDRTDSDLSLSEQKTIDIVGAGDLVSTADDLARFDAAFDEDGFLPAAMRAEMLSSHVEGRLGGVGYGWFIRTSDGGRLTQFHTGSGAGFRAYNYRLPRERMTIIVLSNVYQGELKWLRPMVDRIAATVAGGTHAEPVSPETRARTSSTSTLPTRWRELH